ncbi:MAG: glycoside hydrolase family 3 protein, partial [Actinomyces oris]
MNDRYRPDTSDTGKPLAPGATSQSSPHHVSRRPVLLAALLGAGSLAGCSLLPGSSSAGSSSPSVRP